MSLTATLKTGKNVYKANDGIRIQTSNRGKVLSTPDQIVDVLKQHDKSDRRKIRRTLRAVGRTDLSRIVPPSAEMIY